MPYRRGNYDFVIDNSFRPFSFQEMLAPYAIYKDAFEKSEEAYNELRTKADDFKYLSETLPEGSRAREIYEQYANDLNTQALDFAQNGLTMGNRSALTGLRQRYQGEIGRLAKAQTRLDEETKLRRQMNAKDSSLLYGTQNLSIDDFLDNDTPNLYSISGNELYTKGAAAGQAASKRVYGTEDAGSTLGGYYRDYVQRMGYNAETINRFRQDMSAIPELQAQADAILQANGVYDNLDERGVAQARAQVINGMIDGAVYSESHNPTRDLGVPSWSEKRADARATEQLQMQREERDFNRAINGYERDANGNWIYNSQKDQKVNQAAAIAAAKNAGKTGSSSSGSSSGYGAINQEKTRVSWKGNNPNDLNEDADDDVNISPLDKDEEYAGAAYDYDDLPQYAKNKVDKIIGNKGDYDNYIYYFKPYKGGFFNDQEAVLDIVPRKVMKDNTEEGLEDMDFGGF